jgi:hypothetical protein
MTAARPAIAAAIARAEHATKLRRIDLRAAELLSPAHPAVSEGVGSLLFEHGDLALILGAAFAAAGANDG